MTQSIMDNRNVGSPVPVAHTLSNQQLKRKKRSPQTNPLRNLVIRTCTWCGTQNRHRVDMSYTWYFKCSCCGKELRPHYPLEEYLMVEKTQNAVSIETYPKVLLSK